MDKYYKPEAKDFYEGFEFQCKLRDRNGFMAHITGNHTYSGGYVDMVFMEQNPTKGRMELMYQLEPTTYYDIRQWLEDDMIRVRYLDGIDMQKLDITMDRSWVPKAHRYVPNRLYGIMGNFYFIYNTSSKWMLITFGKEDTVFAGEIKNRSQLEMVLEMIKKNKR